MTLRARRLHGLISILSLIDAGSSFAAFSAQAQWISDALILPVDGSGGTQ
jgi:hypothetical protein